MVNIDACKRRVSKATACHESLGPIALSTVQCGARSLLVLHERRPALFAIVVSGDWRKCGSERSKECDKRPAWSTEQAHAESPESTAVVVRSYEGAAERTDEPAADDDSHIFSLRMG